jgi:hypothetical protein
MVYQLEVIMLLAEECLDQNGKLASIRGDKSGNSTPENSHILAKS